MNAAPLDQPPPEALAEAQRIVQQMKENQRGPYSRIRWFCNDGTVQAPVAYACRERGGGRQHAEYSVDRARLQQIGWSVGTVFAALDFVELVDSRPRQGRLRELPLERYLVDIDDGWVLRRAQNYRGRVQAEDEAAAGLLLLEQLLADDEWASANFLLARESARSIPHGRDTDLARSVRRAAVELAELEPLAERWRAEIHSRPGRDIVPRLRGWAAAQLNEEVRARAETLADDMDLLYGPTGREARIDTALRALRGAEAGRQWRDTVNVALDGPREEQVVALCAALGEARERLFSRLDAARRVALLDAMQELESTVQMVYQESHATSAHSRRELVDVSLGLLECAYGSGLLSARERDALADGLDFEGDTVEFAEYRRAVARLKRSPGWALGTLRHSFAEALVYYTALDPRAARFGDDLLRGSPLWVLGDTLKLLARDVDALAGSEVEIAGEAVATAVALNAGLARGTLRVFETIEEVEAAELTSTDIVALPETIAELSPVGGILTLGEGNALSHVQLLARNFGIPNVAVDYPTVDLLKPLEGKEVLLVVGNLGNVVLRPVDDELDALLRAPAGQPVQGAAAVEVPEPDLGVDEALLLVDVGRSLSGRVVGPKAANLGELNRLFPGRVAPAVAIPFGSYARHLRAAGLDARIADAFSGLREGALPKAEFDAELAAVRAAIAGLALDAETRAGLVEAMAAAFGEPGSYGVFVRSDTNVEDLPQFTGAGLNETIPNVVGFEAQLAAVPRVWASVLSPRALAWRSSVLANPARIYASVLLMKSVPSTKSGVLVTINLANRNAPGLTASVAWGVGGAVAGEAAESIVILDEGVEILSEAKSPYRRHLAATGGVDWLPAEPGAVLEDGEIAQLRALASEVGDKYEPVFDEDGRQRPWDIEFGFVDGELTLFQIRPLVERTNRNADAVLRVLRPEIATQLTEAGPVRLDDPAGS